MPTLTVTRGRFGVLPDGTAVDRAVLSRNSGLALSAMTYGAVITSIRTPDRHGEAADVALGYDVFAPYLSDRSYLGACIGRYANRIAYGRFTLDSRPHQLAVNDGAHHLHGGPTGFHSRVWDLRTLEEPDRVAAQFSRLSADGEEGYPGSLHVTVTYSLHQNGDLVLDYEAATDAPTIVNLTQHTYFNLAGTGTVLGHTLVLDADEYTPVGEGLIPIGARVPVAGTPLDFRSATPIGARLEAASEQLRLGRGYDHNWVIRRTRPGLARAGRVRHPASGRTLEVWTTEPGVQVYGGQLLGGVHGRHGERLPPHAGLCLETQHFPDSPNHPHFPATALRPGQKLQSRTVWRFGVS